MKKTILTATFIATSAGLVFAQTKTESKNIHIVNEFIQEGFNKKNTAALDKLADDNYIQHNAMSADGKKNLENMLQYVAPKVTTVRVFAEADLVVQQNLSTGWGDDKTYVSFDIFRLKNNKVVEHWDVMQENANQTASGHTMTDGETKVVGVDKTEANKKLVQGFLDDIIYGGNFQNITNYISSEKYIQHNPNVKDGLVGFQEAMKYMQSQGQTMKYERTYRIIAEGNFVFVHSKGEFAGKNVAFADLMRVENGKVVEHWDAIQEIPAESKNGHDMFEQISK